MELFCRNCGYRYRFNCISTASKEINCIGIVFCKRCTYLQNLVGWGFISSSVLLYRLVCQTELCFEQASGRENIRIYCNNTGFHFLYGHKHYFYLNTLNQRVRKQVRKLLQSTETGGIAKSIPCE